MKLRWKMLLGLLLSLTCLFFLFTYRVFKTVRVVALDVDQGDAILLQAPEHFQVVIDGGPNNVVVEKLGERLPYFDRTIEMMVLTHPDADHVVGLVEVFERYKVERIVFTGVTDSLPAYQSFLQKLDEQMTEKIFAMPGMRFVIPGGEITVLGPEENWQGKEPAEQNRESVSLRLDVGQTSFLFTGDTDEVGEQELIDSGQVLKANVLKLGHHGSKTSTSEAFLDAVQPSVAIVSAGEDNQFGHPSVEVVERVERRGIEILSTIKEGDVCLEVRGEELWRC